MATNNKKFIADVSAFADKTADQMLRVAKQSIQDTVRVAQKPVAQGGGMPADTGYLRNSLVTKALRLTAGSGKVLINAPASPGSAFVDGVYWRQPITPRRRE